MLDYLESAQYTQALNVMAVVAPPVKGMALKNHCQLVNLRINPANGNVIAMIKIGAHHSTSIIPHTSSAYIENVEAR